MNTLLTPTLILIIILMAYWIDCQRRFIKMLEEYRKKDHEYSEHQQCIIEDLLDLKDLE